MKGALHKIRFIIGMLLQNPGRIRSLFDEEEFHKSKMLKDGMAMNGLPVVDILNLFGPVDDVIDTFAFLEGGSSVLDLILLAKACQSVPHCHYLEIGTWRGESAVAVAPFCTKVVTVNLGTADLRELGLSDQYIASQGVYSKQNAKVEQLEANSLTYDFSALQSKFDVIFIDGDHHYDAVLSDSRKLIPLLRDKNSMIIWHDYGISEESIRWTVYRGIMDACSKEMHPFLYHVSNTKCAIYINKYFEKRALIPYDIPNKKFKVSVKSNTM